LNQNVVHFGQPAPLNWYWFFEHIVWEYPSHGFCYHLGGSQNDESPKPRCSILKFWMIWMIWGYLHFRKLQKPPFFLSKFATSSGAPDIPRRAQDHLAACRDRQRTGSYEAPERRSKQETGRRYRWS
jgi:hypothetical protein